jgi:hypothetical protein
VPDDRPLRSSHVAGWGCETLSLLIVLDIFAVLLGGIAPSNRFCLNEVALVAIVAVGTILKASPHWIDKVARRKFRNLELVVNQVKDEVNKVGGDLEQLQLMLAVLLSEMSQDLLLSALRSQRYCPSRRREESDSPSHRSGTLDSKTARDGRW